MSTTDHPAATPPTAPARSTRVPFVAALVASGVAVTADAPPTRTPCAVSGWSSARKTT